MRTPKRVLVLILGRSASSQLGPAAKRAAGMLTENWEIMNIQSGAANCLRGDLRQCRQNELPIEVQHSFINTFHYNNISVSSLS